MKKLYIIFLFILVGGFTWGQNTYTKFPDKNAIWRQSSGGYQSDCYEFQHSLKGDTVINNLIYHKVEYSGVQKFSCYYNGPYFCYVPYGIREDTINRKIYFYSFYEKKDTLLYDFNLKLGDTLIPTYINSFQNKNYVSKIDSILIGTKYHRRFGISEKKSTQHEYVYLIEGIGSTFGLISQLFVPFEFGTNLLCFMLNGTTVYPYLNSKCELATSLRENNIKNIEFTTSPNPATNELKVDKDYKVESYKIFDIAGKEILMGKNNLNNNTINISLLDKGIYFVRFITSDNKIFNSKFIKE